MSHLLNNSEFLILSLVMLALPVVLCLAVWLPLSRAHKNIRQWTPDTPQREAFLRWNFWSFSLASLGALLRIAVMPASRLNAAQLALRKGIRVHMGLPIAVTLAYAAGLLLMDAEPTAAMDNFFAVVVVYLQLPGLWLLSRIPQESPALEHLAASAGGSIRPLRVATVSLILALMLPSSFETFPGWGSLLLVGLGVYCGLQYFVRYTQMALLAALEVYPNDESSTRAGAFSTGVGLLYVIGALIIALQTPHATYHPDYEDEPAAACSDAVTTSI